MRLNELLRTSGSWINTLVPEARHWLHLPAFIGWIALSTGIVFGYYFRTFGYPIAALNAHAITYITIILLIVAVFSKSVLRYVCLLVAGYLLIIGSLYEQDTVYNRYNSFLATAKMCTVTGTIVSAPIPCNGYYRFMVKADSVYSDNVPGALYNKNIRCSTPDTPIATGNITLCGRFKIPQPPLNPGVFDEYLYSMANNIWGTLYADTCLNVRVHKTMWSKAATQVRNTVTGACRYMHNDDYRAIMVASVINDKSDISDDMNQLFYQAGIYHLIALSGFNIALIAGTLFILFFFVPIRREWKILLSLTIIWLYLLFIGFIPSLFRAVIMATVAGLAFLVQKKNSMLNTLGLAGIVWLIISPLSLFTPSFQLSFAATFGLITLTPIILEFLPVPQRFPIFKKVCIGLWAMLSIAIASFITTTPILIYHFKQFYLFGLFSNLFAVTLMSFSMWAAFAGFLFFGWCTPLSYICMQVAEYIMHIMILGAGLVRYVPWTIMHISIPYREVYALFSLFITGSILISKKLRIRYCLWGIPIVALTMAGCIFLHEISCKASVVIFQTKRDNLCAIRWPNNRIYIIGTGYETSRFSSYGRIVAPWLNSLGIFAHNGSIILPTYQENAVHFLEPLLENNGINEVVCCDEAYKDDDDFNEFVRSYHAGLRFLKPGDTLIPAPACACSVVTVINSANNTQRTALRLRIFKENFCLPPDSATMHSAHTTGAQVIGITPSGATVTTYPIRPLLY
jgi:ComEC/Rec2-related protein